MIGKRSLDPINRIRRFSIFPRFPFSLSYTELQSAKQLLFFFQPEALPMVVTPTVRDRFLGPILRW